MGRSKLQQTLPACERIEEEREDLGNPPSDRKASMGNAGGEGSDVRKEHQIGKGWWRLAGLNPHRFTAVAERWYRPRIRQQELQWLTGGDLGQSDQDAQFQHY